MGRKPLPEDRARTERVQFRMKPPFRGWLERYAASRGLSLTDAIERAIIGQARRDKFEPPPPEGD